MNPCHDFKLCLACEWCYYDGMLHFKPESCHCAPHSATIKGIFLDSSIVPNYLDTIDTPLKYLDVRWKVTDRERPTYLSVSNCKYIWKHSFSLGRWVRWSHHKLKFIRIFSLNTILFILPVVWSFETQHMEQTCQNVIVRHVIRFLFLTGYLYLFERCVVRCEPKNIQPYRHVCIRDWTKYSSFIECSTLNSQHNRGT